MKKTIFLLVAVAALAACSGNTNKGKKDAAPTPAKTEAQAAQQEGRIAYVELDSVNSLYQFCIDQNAALEQEQQGYANTLRSKANAIQQAAQTLQQNVQSGKITTEAAYNQAAAKVQSLQEQYEKLEQQYTEAIAKRTADLQSALQDSINNYIKEFNADGRYSLILGKQSVSILYAAPGYDITAEFVEGLNKRYTKK